MRQRTGIAQALINDPKVLFLDEPTSGLDPIAHAELRDIVASLKNEGKTVFLSSHQLADVELICSRVSIIHKGKLLVTGTIPELVSGEHIDIVATGSGLMGAVAGKLGELMSVKSDEKAESLSLSSSDPEKVNAAIDLIRSSKGTIQSVVPSKRTLEDVFVETVRKEEAA